MSEKTKVVMIDDEEDLCLLVKANLEETGEFEVVTSSNSAGVETLIRETRPDLVLLDVVMPGRKGSDLIADIRKDDAMRGIPIIVVSGKGEMVYDRKTDEFKWKPNAPLVKDRGTLPEGRSAESLASAYHVDDYVSKPFTTELLIEVIGEVLKKRKNQDQPKAEEPLM